VARAVADLARRFDFSRTLAAPGLADASDLDVDQVIDSFAFETANASNRFIVIATQGRSDEAALRSALAAGGRYIAFVGSRRKFETLRARLAEDGLPAEALDAVRAPAGLDISAITPDEIALSILAEMVQLRRQGQRTCAASA
jgi:xanthine dehydrogenase accessory factor